MPEYYFSTNGEHFTEGPFDSVEEATDYAIHEYEGDDLGDTIDVGQKVEYVPDADGFAEYIIERMRDRAYDEAGEWAEDYLNVSPEEEQDLDRCISQAVQEWMKDHALKPDFYLIDNVKTVKLPESEVAS